MNTSKEEKKLMEIVEKIQSDPEKALNFYTKLIEFDPNNSEIYVKCAEIYSKLKNYGSALKNINKGIQLSPNVYEYYLGRGKVFFYLNRYKDAIDDLTEYIDRCGDDDSLTEAYGFRKECYLKIKEFDKARDDLYQQCNHSILEGYCSDPYDFISDSDRIAFAEQSLNKKIADAEKANAIMAARIDEKNKIIADLSHSIKNLISTVIDPLESMKKDHSEDSPIIKNALKGANLIREIVNAMNCSFKGSIDDFYYDVKHNTGKEALILQDIVVQSLTYSIGHMFDGKYFGTFLRKYFPEKSFYQKAKTAWLEKSQDIDLEEIQLIIRQHFISDFKLNITDTANLRIGNDKGSAIKFLILFQELIFNAVKYSAFVKKDKRFLHIHLTADSDRVVIKVENRYKKIVKVKTSGLGLVIIENFAKLLETEPMIDKDKDIYSVKIQFSNLWGKNIE
jgi:signal transduction histidine kinase